jgi:hypothetical protein
MIATYPGRPDVIPLVGELNEHVVNVVWADVRKDERLGILATQKKCPFLSIPGREFTQTTA